MNRADRPTPALAVEEVRQPDLELTTVDFDRQWRQSLMRPLLLTLMLGCVVTAATYVFVVLVPAFTAAMANAIIACSALAALTACIVGAMTWETSRDLVRRFRFRLIEPVGWALALRLVLWSLMGGMPPLRFLISEPLTAIFDGPFIAGCVLVFLTWVLAEFFNRSLLVLSLQPDEVNHISRAYGRLSDTVENTLRSDRQALLDRFIAVWIGIGILVIVLAAGSQTRPAEGEFLTIRAQNIHPRAIVSTIVYFFAGFLVIGQARLVALRARWALDGLAVDASRFRSWMLYVVGSVALVGFITSLVPIGDTILLLRVLTAIATAITQFMFLVMAAFSWLVNSLFRGGAAETEAAPQSFEMPEAFQAEEAAPPPAAGPNLAEPIFWTAVALAALVGVYHLLAARGFDWHWIRSRLALFFGLFRSTVEFGRRIVAEVVNRVTGSEIMARSAAERQARRNMNLDEQVQFAYLSILDAAAEQGVGRRGAETPRRYAPRLAAALREAQTALEAAEEADTETVSQPAAEETPDVAGVTEAFYKARYSPRAASEGDLSRTRSLLQRVRSLWRRLPGSGPTD